MKVLNKRVAQCRWNNKKEGIFLKNMTGITFQNEPSKDNFSNYWLTAKVIDAVLIGGINREDVRLAKYWIKPTLEINAYETIIWSHAFLRTRGMWIII